MRKTFLYSFVGLVGIGSLTGCETLRPARDANCANDGRCSQRLTARIDATRPSVPSESLPNTHLQVGVSWWGRSLAQPRNAVEVTTVENSPANLPQTGGAIPSLPGIGRTSQRIDLPAVDVLAEEDAIVQRESMSKRNGTIVSHQILKIEPSARVPEVTIPAVQEPTSAKEKTLVVKTSEIHYGQADHFTQVTGQVQQFRKSWRLRYADVAQEDPYGGVVVLDGGPELGRLRDGQHVRVTGVLVPPETRTSSATYRVKTIEILD